MPGRVGIASQHLEGRRKVTRARQLRSGPSEILALNIKAIIIAVAAVPRLPCSEILLNVPLGSREVALLERMPYQNPDERIG